MNLPNNLKIDYNLATIVPLEKLKELNAMPVKKENFYTYIAVSKKSDESVQYFENIFKTPVKFIEVKQNEVMYELENLSYKAKIYSFAFNAINNSNSNHSFINDFMDKLIEFALSKNTSDIHIETVDNSLAVRFRIDGFLQQIFSFEYALYPIVSSIIKLLAHLDISQKRLPQNGRFTKNDYDFRVSIMPIIGGESIVIRILDKQNANKNIDELGFDNNTLHKIKENISYSQGMILVTGPTGSGKTTTLYSILKELNTNTKKIITIEDPIEYQIPNIQQIAVNDEIGLTFHEVLRNVLRQDPDILMIGEIRDKKSLQIAIQAALTGHLVLATLHTNDAPSTINRLLDLETKPFLIASTIKAIISQRLIRKLCPHCKQETLINKKVYFDAIGCKECELSGFHGRDIISEIFVIDEQISSMISSRKNLKDIISYAKTKGYKKLLESGFEKVKNGITTSQEVYRTTRY